MAAYLESTPPTGKAHIFYNNATEVASITGAGVLALVQSGSTITLSGATGWTTVPTGTLSRLTFVSDSVTLPQLASRVAALIIDLTSIGLLKP
jgi:hypothetical protein